MEKLSLSWVWEENPVLPYCGFLHVSPWLFTQNPSLLTLPATKWVEALPQYEQILSGTSGVSYNSTQFWHCLPGDGFRCHRLGLRPTDCPPPPNTHARTCTHARAHTHTHTHTHTHKHTSDSSHKCRLSPVLLTKLSIDQRSQGPPPWAWLVC